MSEKQSYRDKDDMPTERAVLEREWKAMRLALSTPRAALATQPGSVGGPVAWLNFPVKTDELGNFAGCAEPRLSFKRESYGFDYNNAVPLGRLAAAPTEAKPAQQDAVDADMVLRAARELCRIHAGECQVNEQDTWNLYAEQFKRDADAVVRAAISAKKGG